MKLPIIFHNDSEDEIHEKVTKAIEITGQYIWFDSRLNNWREGFTGKNILEDAMLAECEK